MAHPLTVSPHMPAVARLIGLALAILLGACQASLPGMPEQDTAASPEAAEPMAGPAPSEGAQQEAVARPAASRESLPAELPVQSQIAAPAQVADPIEIIVPAAPADLVDRIRAGFTLEADLPDSAQARKRVAQQFDWYQRHPDYMNRVFTRARPYLFHIVESLEARGMPLELALLPIVESAFDPFAYSHGRAAGLWQFIPGTGKRFGLKQNWWYDGRRDVAESTRAALDYLQFLAAEFEGDYLLAVAAYNSGEGLVAREIRRNRRAGRPTDFWHLRLPLETRAYVPKLLALRELVRDPQSYGVTLPAIADQPYFRIVPTGGQIDLALAAELAELDLDTLYLLNPGFNRWATDPEGPHRLLVPLDATSTLREALDALPESERVRWQRHRIRSGETLGGIADRYGTTISLLRRINGIRGSRIRAGDDLMIPTARRSLSSYGKSEAGRLASLKENGQGRTRTTYVVQPGDSFWKIASQHGVGVRELAKWNGMAPRDTLSVGRELVIWDANEAAVSLAAAPSGARTTRKIRYTVRRGDSFHRISSRFRVSVDQLVRWNRDAARQKYLRPGQKLVLYVDVTRQSG